MLIIAYIGTFQSVQIREREGAQLCDNYFDFSRIIKKSKIILRVPEIRGYTILTSYTARSMPAYGMIPMRLGVRPR